MKMIPSHSFKDTTSFYWCIPFFLFRSLRISKTNYEPYRKEEIQEVKHFTFLNSEQWYYISFGETADGKGFLSVDGIKEDAVYMKISFPLILSFYIF